MRLPNSSNSPVLKRSSSRPTSLSLSRHKFLRLMTNKSIISKCSSSITASNNTRDMTSRTTTPTRPSRTQQVSSRITLPKATTPSRRPLTTKKEENSSPEEEVASEEAVEAEVAEAEEVTRVVRRESSTDPREPPKRRASKRKELVNTTSGTSQELMDTEANLESNTIPTIDKTALAEATKDKRNPEPAKLTGETSNSSTRSKEKPTQLLRPFKKRVRVTIKRNNRNTKDRTEKRNPTERKDPTGRRDHTEMNDHTERTSHTTKIRSHTGKSLLMVRRKKKELRSKRARREITEEREMTERVEIKKFSTEGKTLTTMESPLLSRKMRASPWRNS
jgi:hypothetical protein